MPVVALCIMGEYRGGKSTFLNFVELFLTILESIYFTLILLIETGDIPKHNSKEYTLQWMKGKGNVMNGFVNTTAANLGFSVSPGTDPNTIGIRFWKKVFVINRPDVEGGKLGIVLMDTQGLWDPNTDNKTNCSIYGLSCMLSSYLIVNNKGVISSKFMETTSSLMEFCNNMNNQEKSFQHLDILIRDHPDFFKNWTNEEEYLSVCNEARNKLENSSAMKESTDNIKSFFQSFDVFCLPNPGNIDSKGYKGDLSEISDHFLIAMGYYIEHILMNIQPRKLNGVVLTGNSFSQYMNECGELFKKQHEYPPCANVMDAFYLPFNEKEKENSINVLLYIID